MQVLRLYGVGDVRVESLPDPDPAPDESLIRITAVGLCGSDLHWFEEGGIGDDKVVDPMVLGHEMGGVVASGPREGERVIVEPANSCGRCDVCVAGHTNLCQSVRFAGHYPLNGGMATYMVWPRRLLVPVPDSIQGDELALAEPLGIALHAIDLGHVRSGMRVGVYGAGPIGQFLIRALRARGVASIVATEPLAHRREAALASGATEVRDVGVDGRPDGVETWDPVDVAFDAAGTDGSVATAMIAAKAGGRVVLVGLPSNDRTTFEARTARHKGLTIAVAQRMKPLHMHAAIDLYDRGVVDPAGIISHRYPLSDGLEAFAALADRRGMKIVINP